MPDDLESAIRAGAIAALRKRADVQRQKAEVGITVVEHGGELVNVVASEARHALKIATGLENIAAELEAEARS